MRCAADGRPAGSTSGRLGRGCSTVVVVLAQKGGYALPVSLLEAADTPGESGVEVWVGGAPWPGRPRGRVMTADTLFPGAKVHVMPNEPTVDLQRPYAVA